MTTKSVILLFLVIQNFSCAVLTSSTKPTNKVFCVSNNSSFYQNYNYSEYHILSYYMNHSSKYFKSYESYVFQPEKHTPLGINTLIFIHVANLTLTGLTDGSSVAVIDCNGKFVSFQFKHTYSIIIENLTFYGCTHSTESDNRNDGLATLSFIYGIHLSLLGVTLLRSVDESFFIVDIFGDVKLSNLMVANASTAGIQRRSAGNKIMYRNRSCNRRVLSQLHITSSIFSNNSVYPDGINSDQDASGLSIYLECPNITVKIDNVTMSNNVGDAGGNMYIIFFTRTHFNISVEIFNSIFEGGNATVGGGMHAEFVVGSSKTSKAIPICPENYQYHKLLHIYNT